jgi:hypothetical protein
MPVAIPPEQTIRPLPAKRRSFCPECSFTTAIYGLHRPDISYSVETQRLMAPGAFSNEAE